MPKTYADLTVANATAGNAILASDFSTLFTNSNNYRKPPMCRITRAAAQAVANSTNTLIQFTDGAAVDTDGMFSSGANTKITIRTAGVYIVSMSVNFALNATGERFANVRLNGNVSRPIFGAPGTANCDIRNSGCSVLSLAVNDELTLNIFQTSGGNLNLDGCDLCAVWVGQAT